MQIGLSKELLIYLRVYLNFIMNKKNLYGDLAKLHIETLEDAFLPTLGENFLTLLYKTIDKSKFTTVIYYYENKNLIGFVSGTLGTESIYKRLLMYPFSLLKSLIHIIFSPKKIFKIIGLLVHMNSKVRKKYPKAELLTICVNKNYRRRGYAKKLYEDLSFFLANNGVESFTIIVGENLKANNFYENEGAIIMDKIITHSGTESNIYVQNLK